MAPEETFDDEDLEFNAVREVYSAMKKLDPEAQQRTLDYVSSRLGLAGTSPIKAREDKGRPAMPDADPADSEEAAEAPASKSSYSSLAELFDAASPTSQSDKALVAGYWLQVCQGSENFDGFSVNKELKNLGEGLGNVTNAIEGLKNQKPALALQLAKSGKSQQARKTYKITVAGVRAVEKMING